MVMAAILLPHMEALTIILHPITSILLMDSSRLFKQKP
jgi:hypothetical protein